MNQTQLIGLVCAGVGVLMTGQLFINGPEGAAWYRFYIMVAGASVIVPGIVLTLQPKTELRLAVLGVVGAFLVGAIGITIGLVRG